MILTRTTLTRTMVLLGCLYCLLGLAACAGAGGGTGGPAEGTDAFVHRQLDRRGL